MTYLYGDSSASSIQIDYIEFLRRALDVLADSLLVERDLRARDSYQAQLEAEAVDHEGRLRELAASVHELMAAVAEPGRGDTPPGRCATTIDRAAGAAAETEIARVRAAFADQLERLGATERDQRSACLSRWAGLLAVFDLPGARDAISLEIDAAGRYGALLSAATDYGVTARLELAIPESHAFSRPAQVQRFAPDLELRTAESGRWLRKEPRVATHKLGKHYLARVGVEAGKIELALRVSPELPCAGYDVSIGLESHAVTLNEVDRAGLPGAEIGVGGGDELALHDFGVIVALAARELVSERRSLIELAIDGASLTVDGAIGALVDRVIAAMAPTVHEIAERSVSDSELVLRRQLGENRREEIFVGKAELASKLRELPGELAQRFAALGLGPLPRAGTSELDPDMIVVEVVRHGPPPPPGASGRTLSIDVSSREDAKTEGSPRREPAALGASPEPEKASRRSAFAARLARGLNERAPSEPAEAAREPDEEEPPAPRGGELRAGSEPAL